MKLTVISMASVFACLSSAEAQISNYQLPGLYNMVFKSDRSGIRPVDLEGFRQKVSRTTQEYSTSGFTLRAELTPDGDNKGYTMYSVYSERTNDKNKEIEKFSYDVGGNMYFATKCSNRVEGYVFINTNKVDCVSVDRAVCSTLSAQLRGKTFSRAAMEAKNCVAFLEPTKDLKSALNNEIYQQTAKSDRQYVIDRTRAKKTLQLDWAGGQNFTGHTKSDAEEAVNADPEASKKAFLAMSNMLDACSTYFPTEDKGTPPFIKSNGTAVQR